MNDTPALAKKSLGQHWLNDQPTLEAICAAGDITSRDTVLEIGPGTGTLTRELLKHAGQVVAIEKDEALATRLAKELAPQEIAPPPGGKLQIVSADILQYDLTTLPPGYKVVANIPYYLTSNLIRILSESSNQPAIVVLLVQKEVAQRVAAKPGSMSLLSVTAQFYWEVSLGQVVPAKLFTPPPKVDSQVLVMKRRPQKVFPGPHAGAYFQLVKAGFSNRRKTLLNSLSAGLQMSKPDTIALLGSAGISPGSRPQELSLDDWQALYKAANP